MKEHASLLLSYGADPNLSNIEPVNFSRDLTSPGFTEGYCTCSPSKIACYNGHIDTVKLLLGSSADINQVAGDRPGNAAQTLAGGTFTPRWRHLLMIHLFDIKKVLDLYGAKAEDFPDFWKS